MRVVMMLGCGLSFIRGDEDRSGTNAIMGFSVDGEAGASSDLC